MKAYQSHNKDAWNKHLFTAAQKAMLQMSEEDIKNGRLISKEELDEEDLKWLESIKQNESC